MPRPPRDGRFIPASALVRRRKATAPTPIVPSMVFDGPSAEELRHIRGVWSALEQKHAAVAPAAVIKIAPARVQWSGQVSARAVDSRGAARPLASVPIGAGETVQAVAARLADAINATDSALQRPRRRRSPGPDAPADWGPRRRWGPTLRHEKLRAEMAARSARDRALDAGTLALAEPDRPRHRGECCPAGFEPGTTIPRPEGSKRWWREDEACPWASCVWNLRVHLTGGTGTLKELQLDDGDGRGSCALDFAEQGGMQLEAIGAVSGWTRERVRQIEVRALVMMRSRGRKDL